jgi:hypothetical protein
MLLEPSGPQGIEMPVAAPAAGVSYSHSITIGNAAPNYGFRSGSYGTLSPATFEGETLFYLEVTTSGSDRLVVGKQTSGQQIGAITSIDLTFEGAADNPYACDWEGTWYFFRDATPVLNLHTYLVTQDGNTIGVDIADGS